MDLNSLAIVRVVYFMAEVPLTKIITNLRKHGERLALLNRSVISERFYKQRNIQNIEQMVIAIFSKPEKYRRQLLSPSFSEYSNRDMTHFIGWYALLLRK